jgi:N-acetyldiaminopimelate deacetylase
MISLRRQLHQTPELAFEEFRTRDLLLSWLEGMKGIRIHRFQGSTGILVEYTAGEGDYRLFRADMDALPVTERTGCSYQSGREGMMHACGHDIHMTVLMGLIERVCVLKPERNLLFLFQPAEEGKGGAESVLAEGLIQSFPVCEVYALHVASGLEVGTVSSRAGIFFGIPQEFDVAFKGKAAHAAYPEQGVNAMAAARKWLDRMDEGVAEIAARDRVIFHIGKMEAGTIRNVVPDLCRLEGTHRSLDKGVRDRINELILASAAACKQEFGVEYGADFLCSYDPVVNDGKLAEALREVCSREGYSFQEAETAMTGEDFGFFTSIWPGLLFWLGSGCNEPLHSDKFLPDEACIPVGVDIMAALATR